MSRYPFIVVEGQDGTGKTTLRKSLFRLLGDVYGRVPLSVLTVNYIDHRIVRSLVEGKYRPGPDNREAYLEAIIADKGASIARLVRPALATRPVIADRWLLSDMVFFHLRHGIELADIYARLAPYLELAADVTLLLELDVDESRHRAGSRSGEATQHDWDRLDVQQRLRSDYRDAADRAAEFPLLGAVRPIDAAKPRETVLQAAWMALLGAGAVPRRASEPSFSEHDTEVAT